MSYQRAIALHDKVFGRHEIYSNEAKWASKNPKIYMYEDVGFLVVHENVIVDHNKPLWNLWLCGVLPEHRNKGIFKNLLKQFKDDHPEVKIMSVRTHMEKYEDMYRWVNKHKVGELDIYGRDVRGVVNI